VRPGRLRCPDTRRRARPPGSEALSPANERRRRPYGRAAPLRVLDEPRVFTREDGTHFLYPADFDRMSPAEPVGLTSRDAGVG
jgi:hypothetical protein